MKSGIFKNPKINFIELRYVRDIESCVKMHLHEELTITAIKKGSLNLIFNDNELELKSNEIAIINRQIPHCATLNKESKDGYVLYLKKDYLKNINFDFFSSYEIIKQKNIYKNFIKLCDCLLDKKISLIEKEENFFMFCLSFFSFEQTIKGIQEESKLALNIKKYLDENFLEEFILDDLAKEFNLSVVHLIRVFKKEFGLPIHSYILNKKVHLAKELLSLNRPIIEVAQNSGFFDQSHLNRSFKRIFQITPKEYQNSIFK
ncbi:helix-turn-helix transcriptional regulator [Arcobacter porcinus]|uniref:Multiple antibiotic resistance protein MarA n=1 Tax=Arcobacter porcinus TaxID=1935204 RepID=A0ABX2YDH3_9BACT|nr:AraC family transcriptional regulator [Arcobacter porcinus]OCL83651.1 Multiple antibiotic resistance protein MarA [Arcobacter porcinus]OCL83870.1 Multiple antibiotic resistance protein MarA [Arcobacter porcinus]OCL92863.1 Multiple antibiotic resistance protein MarA [Arcobacter porcinus]